MPTVKDVLKEKRETIKAALNRNIREYNEETGEWTEIPCTKEVSIEIAMEAYDLVAHETLELLYASKALEKIMNNHNLRIGKEYTLDEYMEARQEVEENDLPKIKVIK